MPQGVKLCPACAGDVCSARYLQPPPFLPCVSARHLLYPSLAFHARCPTLGASFSCLHALMPFVSARHSVALCLGFPTCVQLAFVFLQALHSPRATLQPSWRVPIVSDRRLVRLSLAFTQLCHSCLPDTQLLFVLDSPPWPDKRHKV